jgi:hypothetical protein
MRESKPIVLLELKGPGRHFSFDDAFELMSNLQKNMPLRNPWCIDELYAHLGDESLASLQNTVKKALEIGRAAKVCHLNIDGYVAAIVERVRSSIIVLSSNRLHSATAGRPTTSKRSLWI